MKRIHTISTSIAAICLASVVLVISAPSAKGQGAETSAGRGESSIAALLRGLESRSRDSHSTFGFMLRYDGDLDIGRKSMLLQGQIDDGVSGDTFQLVATADDEMDIRSVTLFPTDCEMQLYFISDFDPGDPDFLDRLSGFFFTEEGRGGVPYHPDPPIRLREGDAIIVFGDRSTTTGNAFAAVTLRGTVPVPAGGSGDLLRVD